MKKSLLLLALCAFALASSAFAKKSGAAIQDGLVRVEPSRQSGAVLIYLVSGKKVYPVVQTSEHGQSNYLSVFVDGKERRLNQNGHCSYHFEVDDTSITETITLKGVAEVTAVYSLAKSDDADALTKTLDIRHTVKNLADKKTSLALKAVYNLCLGENRRAHFSTAVNREVSSEYCFEPSKEECWIISSDGQNAVELELYGKGITAPKRVAAANKDVIDLSTLVTQFTPGNSFDSIMSYNDSALALFWEPVSLGAGESKTYSYKMNFSVNDFQNSGREIASVQVNQDGQTVDSASEEKSADGDLIETSVDSVDPAKMNMEYVQQLINHINSLEQSDPSLNRFKIQQLQTEVDEVLQALRSRK